MHILNYFLLSLVIIMIIKSDLKQIVAAFLIAAAMLTYHYKTDPMFSLKVDTMVQDITQEDPPVRSRPAKNRYYPIFS